METTCKKCNSSIIVVVIMMVISSFVFFNSDSPFCHPLVAAILPIVYLCLSLFLLTKNKVLSLANILALVSVINYFFLEFIHSYGHLTVFSFLFVIILSSVIVLPSRIKCCAYNIYYKIVVITSFIGVLCYFLYVFGVGPLRTVGYYSDEEFATYANYVFSNILALSFNSYDFARLCALYNEPGLLGTVCALLLIIDDFKNIRFDVILIVAGVCTFSVAFWILFLSFLAAKACIKGGFTTRIALLIIVCSFFFFVNRTYDNIILESFFSRFRFEDGQLAGDDRLSMSLDGYWNTVKNNREMLLFGYGQYIGNVRSSSVVFWIVKHGIIGILSFILPLLVSSIILCRRNIMALIFVGLFFLSIYQRPQVFSVMYFIILFGGIEAIRNNSLTDI